MLLSTPEQPLFVVKIAPLTCANAAVVQNSSTNTISIPLTAYWFLMVSPLLNRLLEAAAKIGSGVRGHIGAKVGFWSAGRCISATPASSSLAPSFPGCPKRTADELRAERADGASVLFWTAC